jgi:hypothetical protein
MLDQLGIRIKISSSGSLGNVTVDRYILPHERKTLEFRQHPAVLLQPVATALGSVMAAGIVSAGASDEEGARAVVWILAVFLAIRAFYLFLLWFVQFWAITNARLLTVSGFFARAVTSYDLQDLRYCAFERTFGGRLLGYGTIVFNAGKLNRTLIDYLPYPEQIYLQIYGIVSPELAHDDSFNEDDDDDEAAYGLGPPDVDQSDPG